MQAGSAVAAETCVFNKYSPVSVAPYNEEQSTGYDTYSLLKGAQLYIPAQEGLTKEWLQLTLQQALASKPFLNDEHTCHLSVRPEQVVVVSAGNGFWVQLIGHDEREAEQLLHWATHIVHDKQAQHAAAKH
jgi:hypothetical protein